MTSKYSQNPLLHQIKPLASLVMNFHKTRLKKTCEVLKKLLESISTQNTAQKI
jgi:hypothetical protein